MRTFQEIKNNYRFTDPDIETLKGLLPVVEPHVETIVSDFYNLLLAIPDTAKFLKDAARLAWLKEQHHKWVLALFQGPYDETLFPAPAAHRPRPRAHQSFGPLRLRGHEPDPPAPAPDHRDGGGPGWA